MPDRGSLLKILGIAFGLAVTIGNAIGAGILRAPGEVAGHLPSPSLFLLAWTIGGLYACLGALQIAELGAMIPRSGGQYVFAREALGPYAGFVVGWSDWLSTCGTTAVVSIVVGDFATALLPPIPGGAVTIAVAVAIVFAIIQWRGIGPGSRTQNATSLVKAALVIVLAIAAFIFGGGPSAVDTTTTSTAAVSLTAPAVFTAFVLALQGVIYTYDGWTASIYFSEEFQDPPKTVPSAVIGGALLLLAIYLMINAALLYALPMTALVGEDFALGALASAIFGSASGTLITILTIVAMFSGVNSNHLMASRVLFAMSSDGLFSPRAAVVNAGGTPTVALLVSTVVALLFIVLGRTFAQVITVLAFFFIANYTLSFLSLFVLRWRAPERPRPYRAWGYPLTTALALVGSVAFLAGAIAGDTRNSIYALVLLAASYPIYRYAVRP